MSIRQATREDVDAVRAVAERSWRTDYRPALTRETVETAVNDWYAPERIEAELGAERTLVLVAEADEIVGFSHATWSDEDATGYILRIYVDPDHRRERIGRALLERTCADLGAEGVERINAMVLAANEPGADFYEHFGFEFADERTTTIGEETYPERRYVLESGSDGGFV
ncbi:N-acetyltransferase [Salinigranum rubrum]|uniref:N-acetyltransferase n=1 Tax=Salinigranum rubrum TaxID=755307 RepID=A0A2I8VNX3_9EURY|nr:GNAT family N-acetyltransferase [Salinigranum rubrum]AUV83618.1 N-acetyltransferase [Salinigranum rubrum]